jgi:hypothetical protein
VSTGEKYLAAAYVVLLLAVLAWAAILSLKVMRLQRETEELARLATRRRSGEPEREEAPVG